MTCSDQCCSGANAGIADDRPQDADESGARKLIIIVFRHLTGPVRREESAPASWELGPSRSASRQYQRRSFNTSDEEMVAGRG